MPKNNHPTFMCREVTFLCQVDRHTRKVRYKVWSRTGLSGQDPARENLYEGDDFLQAYLASTNRMETVTEHLLPGKNKHDVSGVKPQ